MTLRALVRARLAEMRAAPLAPIRTVADVARATGRGAATLEMYLRGERRVLPDLAAQLAAVLGVDVAEVEAAAAETLQAKNRS